MFLCKADWCDNKPNRSGKGYCRTHYDQIRKYGKILNKRTARNKNDIILRNDYAEMILRNKEGKEVARALIDIEDIDIVKQYKWSTQDQGYVRNFKHRQTKYLHRIVMNAKGDEEIDHINLNKLDNRKANLRKCKHYQNCFNRKSKYRGIRKITDRMLNKPYYATITAQGEHISLGYFYTKEEALQARIEAEKKYHKNFQYQWR